MDLRQWGGKFAADEWKLVISASWQIDFSKGVFSGIDMLCLQVFSMDTENREIGICC